MKLLKKFPNNVRASLRTWLEENVMVPLRGPNAAIPVPGCGSFLRRLWEYLVISEPVVGLTLNDVYFCPEFNGTVASREEVDLRTRLTKTIHTASPLLPSNMQTVINRRLAQALIDRGQVVIYHRYFGHEDRLSFARDFPGQIASLGVRHYEQELRAGFELLDAGAAGLCIETTHGDTYRTLWMIDQIVRKRPDAQVMVGNIVTYSAAMRAIRAGAAGLKVGMGPGSPCTTRNLAVGVPQATAIAAVAAAARAWDIPVCADGGVQGSFGYNVAVALGASTCMMGQFFARSLESAQGKLEEGYPHLKYKDTREIDYPEMNDADRKLKYPHGIETRYLGEASDEARKRRSPDDKPGNGVAEGKGSWIPVDRTVAEIDAVLNPGLRAAMGYTGSGTVADFHTMVLRHTLVHRASPGYHNESSTRFEQNSV